MPAVALEVKYQVLKDIPEIQEMIEPGRPLLDKDGAFIFTSYSFGDILPEGTVRQWGEVAIRRMINNELIAPIGHWESERGGRQRPPAPPKAEDPE